MSLRPLTPEEHSIWVDTINTCTQICPYYVKTLWLLRPMVDTETATIYTDPYSRVGVSTRFFTLTPGNRVGWVLHEALHLINNHFDRSSRAGHDDHELSNIAGDLEINQLIIALSGSRTDTVGVEIPHGLLPEQFGLDENQVMEEYYTTMYAGPGVGTKKAKDAKEAAQHSPCAPTDDDTIADFDAAGCPRAEDIDVKLAQEDAQIRVEEFIKNENTTYGNTPLGRALQVTLQNMRPPKSDWRSILRKIVAATKVSSRRGHSYRSYRTPSRRTEAVSNQGILLPTTYAMSPTAMFAVDTSGSMNTRDFTIFASEVEAALKMLPTERQGVTMFPVDTMIAGKPQRVSSVQDFKFSGGGGTDMGPAFTYVRELGASKSRDEPEPDLFVLATDGFIPWRPVREELQKPHKYTPVILITNASAYKAVPKDLHQLAHILDCS